ncbi:MAG TPA: MFS transporter, partial [Saprospiraceae bacterium]|nr:MFS transporter [Saprospiraceae bacterium]
KMAESPLFAKIKKEGKISSNPLKESFAHKTNLKMVLLALFAAVMGQGVVWYTGQFYAQTFIERTLSVEFEQVRYLLCIAILAVTPFFLVFGAWSDKIGRKAIMMGGMFLAIITYRPIYKAMYNLGDPKAKTEIAERGSTGMSIAVAATGDSTITTTTVKAFTDGSSMKTVKKETKLADKSKPVPKVETVKTFWLSSSGFWLMTLFVFIQILYVTMVYGPIAAFLVELFPTRIRYTSMSLPYHIGNGIFGGLTPFIATRLFDASKTTDNPTGDPYVGLWYPIVIASVCFVLGMIFLPSKNDENVLD